MTDIPSPWELKNWGKTKCVENSKTSSRHHLEIGAGGYCSVHYHMGRANTFIVRGGTLKVVWAFAWQMHSIVLKRGNSFTVPSKIPHQFQALEFTLAEETYFSDRTDDFTISLSDIERLTTGNKLTDPSRFQECGDVFFDFEGKVIKCWKT